jgi:hypothetical protein
MGYGGGFDGIFKFKHLKQLTMENLMGYYGGFDGIFRRI